jgi:hypothetical protein
MNLDEKRKHARRGFMSCIPRPFEDIGRLARRLDDERQVAIRIHCTLADEDIGAGRLAVERDDVVVRLVTPIETKRERHGVAVVDCRR